MWLNTAKFLIITSNVGHVDTAECFMMDIFIREKDSCIFNGVGVLHLRDTFTNSQTDVRVLHALRHELSWTPARTHA